MKQFTLILSFLFLFCFSFTCLLILFWDPSILLGLSEALPVWFSQSGGKIILIALTFITLGCSLSLFAMCLGVEPGARKHVIVENEAGSIGVSLDAVEDFINRKGRQVNGVRDLYVRANVEDGRLSLQTKVILELQENVPEFSEQFQKKIYHELTETLGLKNIKEVRVLIHKIFPKETANDPLLLSNHQQVLLKEPKEKTQDRAETQSHNSSRNNADTEEEIIILSASGAEDKE